MELSAAPARPRAARCLALLALFFLAANAALRAQSSNALKHTLLPPLTGVQTDVQLGYCVAADASFIAMGAPFEYAPGSLKGGVVKVFDATTGALLYVLGNPDAASETQFGFSVALAGGRLVVGVPGDDKAYVYNLAGATPTVPVLTVTTPGNPANGSFGNAVAISGLRVVVGDEADDTGATNAGSVFVFNLASGTPTVPVAVLNNPAPGANDRFGCAVAVAGTRVIVGALADDAGATDAGSAYLFDLAGATPTVAVGTFTHPAPITGKNFGYSVALNGTVAAIGAPGSSTGATDAGTAYVYDVASGTPFAVVHTLNNPSPATNDLFGKAVGVSGNRVVVGCGNDDPGAISDDGSTYVYDITSGTPAVPVATFANPTPGAMDNFGRAVAISGTRVVVGTPGDDTAGAGNGIGYVFDLTSGTPVVPVLTLNHTGPATHQKFGSATTVSGTRVVVGAPEDDTGGTGAGIVTVYDLASPTPAIPVFTLTNPTPANQNFGTAVAASGNLVVVGAPGGTEAAYVYDLASGTPTVPAFTLIGGGQAGPYDFGSGVAISGTRVAVGMPGLSVGGGRYGRVYVFDVAGATPTVPVLVLENTVETSGLTSFGRAVSLSGARLAVGAGTNTVGGASYAGQVFVYDLAGSTPSVPVHVLQKSASVTRDFFGHSVSISGTRLAVGVPEDNNVITDAGAVQIFDLAGATPTVPTLVLNNPNPTGNPKYFGLSVAISGARLVVGSDDEPPTGTERVFVFNLDRATPSVPTATLANPDVNHSAFGLSVAVDGTTVAVGAPSYDVVLPDKGAAYIYGPATTLTQVPTLTAPATGAVFTTSVSVSFTLPEAALPGTVKLSFLKNSTPTILTLAATEETAGTHSFTFSPANPTATAAIASGAPLPDGLYTVALSYQDTIGSYAATSNAATSVRVDNTPPSVAPPVGGFTPLVLVAPAVAPSYTAQAIVTDLGGITSITQSPAPGAALAAGTNLVTVTATDFISLTGSTSFNVRVLTFTQDTDGDGLNDASEFQMAALGFDWQIAQPALVNTLFSNANGAGLYTTSQVQALNMDVPLLARNPATGQFKLTIGVRKSADLQTFTPFPMTEPQTSINGAGQLEFLFTVPDNAAFFRVEPGSP